MAVEFEKLSFTKDWNNASDFPAYEENETQVRADMQLLHDEVKTFINDSLIPGIEGMAVPGTGDMLTDVYDPANVRQDVYKYADNVGAICASDLKTHADTQTNPHNVTAAQVGAAEVSHTHPTSEVSGLATLLSGYAKCQSGSYTGNGLWGREYPNRLTFNFVPKMVIFQGVSTGSILNIWCGQTSLGTYVPLSLSGNTFTWYYDQSYVDDPEYTFAPNQMNESGKKYHWFAVG